MTLFSLAAPNEPLFREVQERYFDGAADEATLELLREIERVRDSG